MSALPSRRLDSAAPKALLSFSLNLEFTDSTLACPTLVALGPPGLRYRLSMRLEERTGLACPQRKGTPLRKLATAVVGGGSLLILTGGLFVSIGAWSALWDAVFVFNFAHSDASLQERIGVVSYLTTLMFPTSRSLSPLGVWAFYI